MKLYLIRHAESYGNIKGKIVSTTDFDLTEKGRLQARRLGEALRKEGTGSSLAAYCSPLARARQTLEELLDSLGKRNTVWTESAYLKEMDLDKKLSFLHAPEGESYQEVKIRC